MIITLSIPIGGKDPPKVWVDSLDLRSRRRNRKDKTIQCWIKVHQRRRHLIVILDGVSQVHGRRSYVAQREGHVPGELALDIQIPLHPIGGTGIEFNMYRLKRVEVEQLEDLVRKAGGRRIVDLTRLKKRSAPWHSNRKQIWQRDDIEDPESAP